MINNTLNSQSMTLYMKEVISSSFVSLVHNKTVIDNGKFPVIYLYAFTIFISNFKSSNQL